MMGMCFYQSRGLSLTTLCLILGLCCGVHGMWFGRPGEGWMRNRVIWQKPPGDEVGPDEGQVDGEGARYAMESGSWSQDSDGEEEDDKRNGQLSSKILFNLIRANGRSSTMKRSAGCEPNEFRCIEDGNCIPEELVCNEQPDCPMGTDETECKFPASHVSSQPSDRRLSHPVARYTKHDQKKLNDCLQRLISGLRIAGPFSRSYTCPVGFSKCATLRLCFDERYACDGYIDCLDGSDELGCVSTPCPAAGYIKCDNQWQCFDKTRTCDGQLDCSDGSDERNCENKACLGPTQVKCADKKQCYRSEYTCDAILDCADGSDENNCSMYQCRTGYRKCVDNLQCYNTSMRCDGIAQCVDGSDEADCYYQEQSSTNTTVELKWQCRQEPCADGTQCYFWNHRCDGITACRDGSDEWDCAKTFCLGGKVKCEDRTQCIWEEWLCDGEVQCNDGSEERGCSTYVPQFMTEAGITEVMEALNSSTTPTSSTMSTVTPAHSLSSADDILQEDTGNHSETTTRKGPM